MEKTPNTLVPGSRADVSLLTPQDLYLFNEGRHYRAYDKLGAHLTSCGQASPACVSAYGRRTRAK